MAKVSTDHITQQASANLIRRLISSIQRENLLDPDELKKLVSTSFRSPLDLLEAIKPNIKLNLGQEYAEENWSAFIAEIENCFKNDKAFIDYRLKQEQEIIDKLNQQGFTSLWQWLVANQERSLIFSEQFSAVGHPYHPCYKTKLDFSDEDIKSYAPEYGNRFKISFAALAKTHALASYADQNFDIKASLGDSILKTWSEELSNQGYNPDMYYPIAIHPWQLEHIIPTKFSKLIEAKQLIILDNSRLEVTPTLSLRTVMPTNSELAYHIKLPVTAQMTSARRSIPPSNIHNGPLWSDLINRTLKLEDYFDNSLDFMQDQFGIIVKPSDLIPYNDTRHLCTLFRENTISKLREDEIAIPLAMTYTNSPLSNSPLIYEIIGSQDADTIYAFFDNYVSKTLAGQLAIYLRYGIALEAHQQNTFLVFQDNQLSRTIVRDSSDIEFYKAQLDYDSLAYPLHHKTYQVKDSRNVCRQTLLHTVFYSNIIPLIELLASSVDRAKLIEITREKINSELDKASSHISPEELAEERFSILESQEWPCSGLLRMRLAATEQYIHSSMPNPLR